MNPVLSSGDGLVDVEGGQVWYGVMGEGNKPPYLCLHGGPGSTSRWFLTLADVAQDRPVILMDQLGSGFSTYHEDTSLLKIENFVAQVQAVKEALDLNEFYLMGHSWGTALALEYYTVHPEGIKGIVFNSPYFSTVKWIADTDTLIATLPDSIQHAIFSAEKDLVFDTDAYKAANQYFFKRFLLRSDPDKVKRPPYALINPSFDTTDVKGNNFIYNYMWGPSEFSPTGTLLSYENTESLNSINIPVLFTTGEYDEARPTTVKSYVRQVKNGQYIEITGAGHATFIDNLELYVKAHRDFANGVDESAQRR
jgi:proline iminopeptidase